MDRVLEHVKQLGCALRLRNSEIGSSIRRRLHSTLPEYYEVDSPDFQEAGWGALYVVIDGALTALENDGRYPDQIPAALVSETLAAVRNGLSWELLDRTYHVTHQLIWESVFPELAKLRLSRDDEALVLRVLSDLLFRYFDHVTTAAGQTYARAKSESVSQREQRRIELVRQAIEGVAVPDAELGYRTSQVHVGMIGWGEKPLDAVNAAARKLGAEVLAVPAKGSYLWAWIGSPHGVRHEDLLEAVDPPPGTYVALGSASQGRIGFAVSHRQAGLACSVHVRKLVAAGQPVIAYRDVALEGVALENEAHAKIFLDHELGDLAGPGPRNRELRHTLVAYSRSALSARAAARLLGIAERTVRYRIGKLESLLGASFSERLPSLVLAVRLLDALDAQNDNRLNALSARAGSPVTEDRD